jgi:hypothetical protein
MHAGERCAELPGSELERRKPERALVGDQPGLAGVRSGHERV